MALFAHYHKFFHMWRSKLCHLYHNLQGAWPCLHTTTSFSTCGGPNSVTSTTIYREHGLVCTLPLVFLHVAVQTLSPLPQFTGSSLQGAVYREHGLVCTLPQVFLHVAVQTLSPLPQFLRSMVQYLAQESRNATS